MIKNLIIQWVILISLLAICYITYDQNNDVQEWAYSHLRIYDPPDTDRPEDDIIAVYVRESLSLVEIRLDFLVDRSESDHDLYIALDTLPDNPSSENNIFPYSDLMWEYLLVQKSGQSPFIKTRDNQLVPNLKVTTHRDPTSGALILSLEKFQSQIHYNNLAFQVFVTNHDSENLVEQTGIAFLNNSPPVDRAHLLLTFWNSLPAKTPALTLRRWDGAHTGPYGQRHGLKHLLQSSIQYNIPLVLLDLKTPESLAALEYIGQIDQIRIQEALGNLILPENSFGDSNTSNVSLNFSKLWTSNYHLLESQFAFGQFKYSNLPTYAAFFADISDNQHIQTYQGHRLIPLPAPVYPLVNLSTWDQVDRFGLTINAKRALIDAALSEDPSRLVVFGGSLPETAWGDSSVAPTVFAYLESHPWIQILSQENLLTFPIHQKDLITHPCVDLLCSPSIPEVNLSNNQSLVNYLAQFRSELAAQSDRLMSNQAWLTYFNFTTPSADPKIFTLRSNYLASLEHVLMAARWASEPYSQSICEDESCILSSENTFCLISQRGARLLLAASLTENGYLQWVAPVSQLAIGLSDPLDWHPGLGEASDPDEIPGAFSDPPNPFTKCISDVKPGRIAFDCEKNGVKKIYKLLPESLEVIYLAESPITTRVPLVSLPAQSYFKGCENSLLPNITAVNAKVSTSSYCDSRFQMKFPEDPDINYLPGHFLPFPLTILNINSLKKEFSVKFIFQ
jgi:hypothetical protein